MKKEDAIKYLKQLYPNGGHCWLDEQRIEAIGMAVKALQEEPVSNPIDFEKELYKAFGQVKDFTLGMRIAKWFYDMGKNSQEPVSDDLEQVAITAADEDMQGRQIMEESNENRQLYSRIFRRGFKAGAKWQEEQFEKNFLEHFDAQTKEETQRGFDFVMGIIKNKHRIPTFDDAIKCGMKLQRENMMNDAVNGLVYAQRTNGEVMFRSNYVNKEGFEFGDKVKMILIKED